MVILKKKFLFYLKFDLSIIFLKLYRGFFWEVFEGKKKIVGIIFYNFKEENC